MSKLPITDLPLQDAIFYTNLLMIVLVILLGSFITYAVYKTIVNENKRKKYTPKKGDNIYTPVMSGSIKGEVLEVNDDKVKVIIEVHKSRIYPE